MKEQIKLKGIVSARDSRTGKIIFENLHNTVVLGGCLSALAKIAGVEDIEEISDEAADIPGLSSALVNPITHYNFTYGIPAETAPARVDKAFEEFASEAHVFDLDSMPEVGFFDGQETYAVADVGKSNKHIILLDNGALTFIRYKLPLLNSGDSEDKHVIKNKGDGGITYVNSIELFSVDESDPNKINLFSKLNFPAIPFFGNLSIDFEYRIYL
jgi:hypothetical protein